jgi:hypothetical protein
MKQSNEENRMKSRSSVARSGAALLAAAFLSFAGFVDAVAQEIATGLVYHDANGNGARGPDENGLGGVGVSNGREVVRTGGDGRYSIPLSGDTIVFVIKPSGWRTVRNENGISRFYYVHKPNGSPDGGFKFKGVRATGPLPSSIDFPLYRQEEPSTFKMICFGDTQPRTQEEVDWIAHDVVEELIGFDAAFGITLGDVVFDDLALFEPLERTTATIGVPWYNIHGNHDVNKEAVDDPSSDETWERLYGPSYYSFDYGQVHFVAVDNVAWELGGRFHGELGERPLAFLRNDLALVPEGKLVVLMMHIPLVSLEDKQAVYDILDDRPNTFTVAAHWHSQSHFFVKQEEGWGGEGELHHLVHATVCGSWWSGAKDEDGIPHTTMTDGAPNGYSIVTFDGSDYSIRFKAARRPADHQMNIYVPEAISRGSASDTQVIVNVFAGSERSTVEMRLGESGPWQPMTRTRMKDPFYMELKELEPLLPREFGRPLPEASDSNHIWTANLPTNPPKGVHLIHVRTTDMFGQTYTDRQSIRVE